MKGISTIIAIIIIVIITISLAGTAYLFMSGVLTGMTSKTISLLDADLYVVIIQNLGTDTISSDEITILVNGEEVDIINPQDIQPQESAVLKFIPPDFGTEMRSAKVIIISPSNSLNYVADFIPHELKVDSNTVALWHLNENTGTSITDSSTNNNNGNLIGSGDEWTTGKFNYALDFDGNNEYVDVSDDVSQTAMTELTISAWFNATVWSSQSCILSKWSNIAGETYYLFGYPSGTNLYFYIGNETASVSWTFSNLPSIREWHHVVGVYKAGEYMKLFIDGVEISESTTDILPHISNQVSGRSLFIGRYNNGALDNYANGIVDEVIIYNKALTQEEILDSIYR